MSRCGRTAGLEAVVRGELSATAAAELRGHASTCALCRHELNWLETEATLFRQRAGREEVEQLWAGVVKTKQHWPRAAAMRVMLAAAAGLLLAVVVGGKGPAQLGSRGFEHQGDEVLETDALMSPALELMPNRLCSELPSGMGFQCSPPVLASR